jgi:hypothetical protein
MHQRQHIIIALNPCTLGVPRVDLQLSMNKTIGLRGSEVAIKIFQA